MNSNSKQILRNRENSNASGASGASGQGSFLNRNYYRRGSNAGSKASGDSRSGSRSRGLQDVLNRSGSRGRFFNPGNNNSNSKISQNGSMGADRFSALYDDAGTRQN